MTNDQMWDLIRYRTVGFYERVFEPLKLCKKGDFERIEKSLKYLFLKKRRHTDWMIAFLNEIDDAETDIVLHRRKPKSFVDEMEEIKDLVKINGCSF